MKRRGHADSLSDAEREALHRDIRAGLESKYLARKYNLSERTVQVHKAKLNGTYTKQVPEEIANKRHYAVSKVCYVAGCETRVRPGNKFCQAHEYRAPANVSRLTARRA